MMHYRSQEDWQKRERDLLETANRYLERAREAEKMVEKIRRGIEAFNKEIGYE